MEQREIACFFDQLTDSPDDPEGLIRVTGIVIGIPGQHGVPVLKLVSQAFQNFFPRLFGPEAQHGHGDLQVVPHPFLAHNAAIDLFWTQRFISRLIFSSGVWTESCPYRFSSDRCTNASASSTAAGSEQAARMARASSMLSHTPATI